MDDSKKSLSTESGTVSWSAEAVLAAGLVAGSLISRMRNPRMALLVAAGALAWRAFKPRQRPAPMLALAQERMPVAPVMPLETSPSGQIIEATESVEMEEPAVATTAQEEAMALPPMMDLHSFEITREDDVAHDASLPAGTCDAWILGLEPLPVVEELPAHTGFVPAFVSATVQEHKPVIAEGAPLPDMIEISVEPAPASLQISMTPSPVEPRLMVVNEGPVGAPPAPAVTWAEPVVASAAPVEGHVAPQMTLEASVLELFASVPSAQTAGVPAVSDPKADLSAKRAMEWASLEVTPPPPEPPEPITLRPMPRIMPNTAGGETTVSPKRHAVFGMPLPHASVAEMNEVTPAPAKELPRRIIPHAPVTTHADDQQKSWLNWWK